MLDRMIKYQDVLRQNKNREMTDKIIVIRNIVCEPLFGDYLGFYYPSADVSYMDVNLFITSVADTKSMAVVFLSLADLAPVLYGQVYTMEADMIDKTKESLKNTLRILAGKLSGMRLAAMFLFAYDLSEPVAHGINLWNEIVREMNGYLYEYVGRHRKIRIIDTNRYITYYGSENMIDRRWKIGMRYTQLAWNVFSYHVCKCLKEWPQECKKCLILDCDGVLWSGVLADDGYEHLKMNYDFQREVLRLQSMGILVCLCSKNREEDVMQTISQHPEMLIRPEQISGYRINWENKADNILSLAGELNIGTDSMVFIDDSIYETELVSAFIPDIAVICFDSVKPYEYTEKLQACGYFELYNVTDTGRNRGYWYRQQMQRKAYMERAVDVEAYMASLETVIHIEDAEPMDIARIAEISQRTNQFNLSGRKYSEDELLGYINTENYDIYVLSASDRFGNLGIVAAAVVRFDGRRAVIEGFYLSCRAFSRGFEQELAEYIKAKAAGRGCDSVLGMYRETSKNAAYRNFYTECGIGRIEDGQS